MIMAVLPALSPAQKPDANREADLLEVSNSSKSPSQKLVPHEIKIISYNIRWRAGDELKEISNALKSGDVLAGATIIGLQEVDRNKARTRHTNTARQLADDLGMNYAWAAPPQAKGSKEEETGVALLSPYPLTDVKRIVLPYEGPGGRRRVAIGATIKIGDISLRAYSVHAENRILVSERLDQIRAVLDDLDQYPKSPPAIILGDFNTWEITAGDKTKKLFGNVGFSTPFTDDTPTFHTKVLITVELKLDWIWLRGLPFETHGIDRSIQVSDHWPLWTVVKIKK